MRKYGRNIGLNLKVVRIFAYQLLRALSHMRTCAVLHADIKPDNILTDASQRIVKICDFGSAMLAGDNEITPYLVSRFYRSPEVILGLKYGTPPPALVSLRVCWLGCACQVMHEDGCSLVQAALANCFLGL